MNVMKQNLQTFTHSTRTIRYRPVARFLGVDTAARRQTHTARGKELIVWWDSGCPLCTREINFLRNLDREQKIEFRALGPTTESAVDVGTACPMSKGKLLARFHAKEISTGEILSGAAAFAAMWRLVPNRTLRGIGELARYPFVLKVLELSYRGFLVVRPALQSLTRRMVASK